MDTYVFIKMKKQEKNNCNGFEITSPSEKHLVEDDILFTNHF